VGVDTAIYGLDTRGFAVFGTIPLAAPTLHLTSVGGSSGGKGDGALHVTAMGPNLFLSVPLPASGTVRIGRDEAADVRILDEGASRLHAELHVDERAQLFIEDLGTRNGTFVREERIAPRKRVAFQPGEAITIGYTILMVQRRRPVIETRRLRTHAVFEERLHEACERASATAGALALLRFHVDEEEPPGQAADLIAAHLNATDLLAQYAHGDYEVLLPDTGADRPRALIERLERRLRAEGLKTASAVATFPADGRTPDALIGRANELLRGDEGQALGEPILKSEAVRKVYRLAERAASGKSASGLISVLILGETGVGKDVLARWVHKKSPRANGPWVSLNCAALPESLLESELFGHKKGAFTNAVEAKVGLLEAASGGTVFLDEIGDMPLPLQVRMLRAIENREIMRVGEVKPRPIDVRFIAATHRDLEARLTSQQFRPDLYFRLNQISLTLPPLRERPEEIEGLAQRFLTDAVRAGGGKARGPRLSAEALDLLRRYCWPGNARELRNMVERALVLCEGPEITAEHLEVEKMRATTLVTQPATQPPVAADDQAVAAPPADLTADEREERTLINRTLAKHAGSQSATAKELGMARGTLIERLKRYGIRRPRARTREIGKLAP
jgi:two-component system response regulator AtoC